MILVRDPGVEENLKVSGSRTLLTPEEKNAIRVAVRLRHGVKIPACSQCAHAALLPSRPSSAECPHTQRFCKLFEKIIDAANICPDFVPEQNVLTHSIDPRSGGKGISPDNNDPVEQYETTYFNCKVEVWRIKGPYWSCAPWRFAVTHNGKRRAFRGVPNYVETKAKALKRAWYRAKWLANGEYETRYQ